MSAPKKSPRKPHDRRDAKRKAVKSLAHRRHNKSDVPVMDTPISDRKHLHDIKKWVVELHEKQSYRWIAAHTWRGDRAFGFFQRLANGDHLIAGEITARAQDWHDLNLLRKTVRDFTDADSQLFDSALQVVEARAHLDNAVAQLLHKARQRTGVKE